MIYREALPKQTFLPFTDPDVALSAKEKGKSDAIGLLGVSKTIRGEALDLYYRETTFLIILTCHSFVETWANPGRTIKFVDKLDYIDDPSSAESRIHPCMQEFDIRINLGHYWFPYSLLKEQIDQCYEKTLECISQTVQHGKSCKIVFRQPCEMTWGNFPYTRQIAQLKNFDSVTLEFESPKAQPRCPIQASSGRYDKRVIGHPNCFLYERDFENLKAALKPDLGEPSMSIRGYCFCLAFEPRASPKWKETQKHKF